MSENLTRIVVADIQISLLIMGAVFALISLGRKPKVLRRIAFSEALLSYFLLFSIGIGFFLNFIGQVLFPEFDIFSWSHPEIGYAGLGMGIAGFISFRAGLGFRAATLITTAFFLWGTAGRQLYQIVSVNDLTLDNAGIALWTNFFLPIIGFVLLYKQYRSQT